MQGFILALQFFTSIPIHVNIEFSRKNLKVALFFLPFIAILYGGLIALILYLYNETAISAIFASLAYVLFGGALHIDGLADLCDGFAANTSPEKTLSIMNDPHIGTFGIIAIIFDLLIRFVMYQALSFSWLIVMLPSILARTLVLFAISYAKPAKQTGLGYLFHQSISKLSFPIFFTLIILGFGIGCYFKRIPALYITLPFISLFLLLLVLHKCQKRLGGTNGDVNSAIIEILELSNLFLCYLFF